MAGWNDLNQKQKNFVENILKGMNQQKAYMEAGYQSTGNAARVNACRLMKDERVQHALAERRSNRARRTKSQLTTLLTHALSVYHDILKKKDISKEEITELKLKLDTAKDIFDRCELGKLDTEINVTQVSNQDKLEISESRDRLKEVYEELEQEELEQEGETYNKE